MTFNEWFESYAPTAPETLDDCGNDAWKAGAASRDAEVAFLQSRIDELMLEYCPNEMTKDQLDNWAAHQRPVGESELPEAIRARGDSKCPNRNCEATFLQRQGV